MQGRAEGTRPTYFRQWQCLCGPGRSDLG